MASGWCLFDALDIPVYENAGLVKPLLATYGTDCKEFPDPTDPNTEPSCTIPDDCPLGYTCIEGNCLQLCDDDNDCFVGECEQIGEINVCVESDECNPPCPYGWECHEGECYLDYPICHFNVAYSGEGSYHVYYAWQEETPGTTLSFRCKTYHFPDKFTIYEGSISPQNILMSQNCIATSTDPVSGEWSIPMTFTVGSKNAIIIVAEACETTPSKFEFLITCEEELNQPPTNNMVCGGSINADGVTVEPNPFTDNLNFSTEVNTPFIGEARLSNYMGMKVAGKPFEFTLGNNNLNLDGLGNLPPSIYMLTLVKDGEACLTKQVVKTE